MNLVEQIYESAANVGLLKECVRLRADGTPVEERLVGFSAPDDTLLDGLAVGADYSVTYPASFFTGLTTQDTVMVAGSTFLVREIRAVGNGTEMRATLTKV